MQKSITVKNVITTFVFGVILYFLLGFIEMGLLYFLNEIILPIFNWFNKKNIFLKIIIILFGVSTVLYFLIGVFNVAGLMIATGLKKIFKITLGMSLISFLLGVISIIQTLITIWSTYNKGWAFWGILEFLIITTFVISVFYIYD